MRKVLAGLAVALIVGVGGYFGVVYWAQYVVAREVEAVLDGWRASLGSATHGRIEFDLWTRTLKVSDVVVQSRTAPHPKIALAQVIASGIDLSGKATRVEIVDLETSDMLPGRAGVRMDQKAPHVTLTGFSARPLAPRKVASMFDMTRLWLDQFSAITAATIEVPSLTVTLTPIEGATRSPALSAEYTYTNLVLRDVHDGRFAEATMDGCVLRGNGGGGSLASSRARSARPPSSTATSGPCWRSSTRRGPGHPATSASIGSCRWGRTRCAWAMAPLWAWTG